MTCFHSILTVTLRVALASKVTFSSIHGEEASCASSDGQCCLHGKLSCTHFEPCEVPAAPEVFMVQYFATKSTTSGSTQETDGEELRNDRKKSYRSKLADATIEACDWQCYLRRYPDLQTALGATNTAGAEAHYLANGQSEGRDCTCSDAAIEACDWQCYLRRYPDLQTALGATNTAGAEAHYLANGKSEGRGCTCSDEVDTEETGETASAIVAADNRGETEGTNEATTSPPDDVESPCNMQGSRDVPPTVVLARFNEDVQWISGQGLRTMILNRGEHINVADTDPMILEQTHFENVGREGFLYLYYILANYDAGTFAEVTGFCQAEPTYYGNTKGIFIDDMHRLQSLLNSGDVASGVPLNPRWPEIASNLQKDGFSFLSTTMYNGSFGAREPWYGRFNHIFQLFFPGCQLEKQRFSPGSCIAVTRAQILSNSKEWYEKWIRVGNDENRPDMCFTNERAWACIFNQHGRQCFC